LGICFGWRLQEKFGGTNADHLTSFGGTQRTIMANSYVYTKAINGAEPAHAFVAVATMVGSWKGVSKIQGA